MRSTRGRIILSAGLSLALAQENPASATDASISICRRRVANNAADDGQALTPAQQALMLALTSALGMPVNAAVSPSLFGDQHEASVPNMALVIAQQDAATGKRVGETVLLTLLLVRAGDHLSGEPIVLSRAVAGLKAVGLDSEARALALEAALAAGL